MIREGLEKVIRGKEDDIDSLKEALSVPRQHYKFIDNLQADEIVKQKGEILREMADGMGVPEEQLLTIMYKAEAQRAAKNEVNKAIKEQEQATAEEAGEADGNDANPSAPQSPTGTEGGKPKLGADASQQSIDAKPGKKSSDVLGGANKLQRDLSVQTIQSKATAATMEGSLIAPPFKFGTQRQYRELREMDSAQR